MTTPLRMSAASNEPDQLSGRIARLKVEQKIANEKSPKSIESGSKFNGFNAKRSPISRGVRQSTMSLVSIRAVPSRSPRATIS